MGEFSVWHWLIVAGVVMLLFGANKLPQLARSLGQSARVFKAETRGLQEDEEAAEKAKQSGQQITSGESAASSDETAAKTKPPENPATA